jgi:hypothetical protein
MPDAKECRERAAEALKMADTASHVEAKELALKLAQEWMALAVEMDKADMTAEPVQKGERPN